MLKNFFAFLFLLSLFPWNGKAQYFTTGQDPASIRWRQIKTDKYQLIYPEPFEKKSQYLANIMEIVCRNETHTLSARVPRIPITLHTQSVTSNGITVWAPKRIEMYPCPPQQTYAEEWLEQLAIHEYRHAVQISKMNRGFTRAMYYIFGEQITGGILGLFIPSWFLEGDATVTETAMSKTGRGRSAIFESVLRAQILNKGMYSYDKAVLGSYKTYVPDAYMLGYFLVGQTRKMYGAEVWNRPLDNAAKYPFMVVPFAAGIKKETGLSKVKLYRKCLTELDSAWTFQSKGTVFSNPRYITSRDPGNYCIYTHPLFLNDSTIVADKSSMDDIDRFVIIDRKKGHEKIFLTPGRHISGTTSVSGNIMVWAESEPHPRWQNKDYAEIKMYDFRSGKIKSLTRKTRYFAPVISPDGTKVATVFVSTENKSSIRILEIPGGAIITEYIIPENGQALMPNWSPDGKQIIYTLQTEKGQTISLLNPETGKEHHLLPFDYNEYSGPAYFLKQYILFSVDLSGIENLYALDTLSGRMYQVTSARYASGDADFTPDRSGMIYSDYTADGLMVAEIPLDTTTWVPMEKVVDHSIKLYQTLAGQEKANIQDSILLDRIYKMNQSDTFNLARDSIKGKIFPSKKYSKIAHLFNPHSWAPASFDLNNLSFHPGISVMSQNVLSNTFANAGWEYDLNEQTGKFYAGLSYRGWYPVFDFRFDVGNRAGYAHSQGGGELIRFTWQETDFKFHVSIPWNFSHGKFYRYLNPSIGTSLIYLTHNASTPARFTRGLIPTLDFRLYTAQFLKSNAKDMFPKWGQTLELNYRQTPFSGNNMGSIFACEANFYFPGIFRHHGLRCYGGYQIRNEGDTLNYSFSNIVNYPRGYTGVYNSQLLSLSFNYKFPLFYPDFSLGSVFYFKRLKLNLFYDWAEGQDRKVIRIYETCGAELTTDLHLLRFIYPFELGVRSMFFPLTSTWGWEFLYSISL